MKERPILFSTEMVSAILANRKTQTRRIVKGELRYNDKDDWYKYHCWSNRTSDFWQDYTNDGFISKCPYGQVSDVLWVRETWSKLNSQYVYKADYNNGIPANEIELSDGSIIDYAKWKPSIHMPKEACRIRLKIKSVRVERLSDISEQDAIAEGIELIGSRWKQYLKTRLDKTVENPKYSYITLWESINGSMSWEKNPWVWVIEFERIL